MHRILAGDIGGTTTRLALFEARDGGFEQTRTERYDSARYDELAAVVREFFGGEPSSVDRAGFGIAGPVEDDRCRATNLPWVVDARVLERELGIARVRLVNDFHAVALGLGVLGDDELMVLQDRPADPHGPVAIIGAGTGLGEAIVLPEKEEPRVLASEGGHTDFAPRDEEEIELLRFLMARHAGRVSVERAVSGRGLHAIYDFLLETGREHSTEDVRARIARDDPGQVIGEAALQGDDAACVRAVRMFVSAYGAEAGNLALKVLPTGGVFVAGGIAPRLASAIRDGPFMEAFLHKGRMSSLLEQMRVSVVMNARVGLLGAREAATRH